MSNIRYSNRGIRILNVDDLSEEEKIYEGYLKKRNRKIIYHHLTPVINKPTLDEMATLTLTGHIWRLGDRYYKLADQYYDDPKYWWVIAWFNRAPTEAHLKIGDLIQIPTPLEEVLQFY